jgi:COP9 signalosome complex subunit 6
MFESVVDIVSGAARMLFVKLKFTLATEEAERIGLDHVARITGSGGGIADEDDAQSKVADHVIVQHSAIKMLASRVRIILDYVRAVDAGEMPHNHEIMREAKALSSRLPVLEAERFKPEFYTQCNDAALLTYLGVIMKSCNNLNQFINKFGVLYQRPGGSRRMRGLFF